ncbi:MAG: DUF2238 domain-containing protein [Candidatus Paceibacterota bacterium]
MKFKSFFILSLILVVGIALLDFFAFKYFWYWRLPWFDKTMHFFGGFLIALVAIQFYLYLSSKPLTGKRLIVLSVVPALFVGCLWELFEFTAERIYFSEIALKNFGMLYGGWQDSLRDLFFDLFGSLSAVSLFISNLIWTKRKPV